MASQLNLYLAPGFRARYPHRSRNVRDWAPPAVDANPERSGAVAPAIVVLALAGFAALVGLAADRLGHFLTPFLG